MNPFTDDEKLESYLRQFRAQAPSPLPLPPATSLRPRPAAVLAAAVVLLAFLALFWQRGTALRHNVHPQCTHLDFVPNDISIVRLGHVAAGNPESLDSHLTDLSKQLLPDTRQSIGVLKQLSRE